MTVVLSVANLSFSYPVLPSQPAAPAVLSALNFELNAGEWLCLLGSTGSGKSTLCGVIAGLVPLMTGGRLTGESNIADGQTIGYVFQDAEAQLFNMTAEDEIAFGLETAGLTHVQMRERVDEWLTWARLEALGARAPWQLSGGQKKRLALAAVLAMTPTLLLLDEPTAGLDPAGVEDVCLALNTLRTQRGHAVFIATSDVELAARYADRLLVFDAGRIVLEGPPREVWQRADLLWALGIGIPQITQLAHAMASMGAAHDFHSLAEAVEALRSGAGQQAASDVHTASGSSADAASPAFNPLQPTAMTDAILAFDHVWFHYPESPTTLADISFAVQRADFVALVGANGSGKTTLAKHINGLVRPVRGRVMLNGQDIAKQSTAQLAHTVGYVFQNPDHQLFSASVRDEIAFGLRNLGYDRDAVQARVDEALQLFELVAMVDSPPAALSYAVRRIVTLASVWAMRPTLWVLDEPTTGLDARHADLVLQTALIANRAGATIILISHDIPRVAAYARRVMVLREGHLVGDGSARKVFASTSLLQSARLMAPPVTQLAAALGWAKAPLTVAEWMEWHAEESRERLAPGA